MRCGYQLRLLWKAGVKSTLTRLCDPLFILSHAQHIPLTPIFTDTVMFRIAPWIMTPNILPPVSVYVCW